LHQPRRLPRPVPHDDLDKFFAVIDDVRDRAMFTLMLRCGLRIAEVAHLQLVDLYLDEERPRLVARGKGSKERSVYLSPQAERSFRAHICASGHLWHATWCFSVISMPDCPRPPSTNA
jgi:site-specific recombinase XerC